MTIFPASLTTLICKTPFGMTSHNGRLAPKQRCNDVSRPTGCVPIRSFSSLTFPAHQAATVTAIMVDCQTGKGPPPCIWTFVASVVCWCTYSIFNDSLHHPYICECFCRKPLYCEHYLNYLSCCNCTVGVKQKCM